jgi:hypothetical protein
MGTRERDEALVRAGWNDPHVMKTIAQHIAEVDKVHPAPTEVSSERAERDVAVQWSLTLRQVAAWVRTFPHPVSWLATATDLDKMANAVDAGGDADENCSVAMPPPSLVALPLASPPREMSESDRWCRWVDVAAETRCTQCDAVWDGGAVNVSCPAALSAPPRGPVAETGEASEKGGGR